MSERSPVFAVAWDVDGTLVDSEPLHLRCLQQVCRAFAVDIHDFGPQPFVGVAIDEVWRLIGPRFGHALGSNEADRRAAFRAAINEEYLAGAAGLQPMPGVREALSHFDAIGLPMCAVSNSDAPVVAANLRVLGVDALMRFAVTLDDVTRPKPDAEPYRLASARLGVPAARVLAVEDSRTGCESALAAGLAVVQVGDDGPHVPHPAGNGIGVLNEQPASGLPRWHRMQRPDQLIGWWPPDAAIRIPQSPGGPR